VKKIYNGIRTHMPYRTMEEASMRSECVHHVILKRVVDVRMVGYGDHIHIVLLGGHWFI
jgi:hypothetical protein